MKEWAYYQMSLWNVEGGFTMPIVYDKMIKKFDDAGLNSYKIKKDKIIGTVTYQKIRHGGDIDTRTIARMCKFFDCQPGDLLDYVPDDEADKEESED